MTRSHAQCFRRNRDKKKNIKNYIRAGEGGGREGFWEHKQKVQIYKGKTLDCHEIFQCFMPANNRVTFKGLKENIVQGFLYQAKLNFVNKGCKHTIRSMPELREYCSHEPF